MIVYAAMMVLGAQAMSTPLTPPSSPSSIAVHDIAPMQVQQRPGTASRSWTDHYLTAARLIKAGRMGEAGAWFYVGQLRGRINIACVKQDPSGGPAALASFNEMMGKPINEYLGADPDRWALTIQRALAWDAGHADAQNTGAACVASRKSQRDGLAGLRTYILTHKDEIRRERRKNGLPNT